MLKKHIYSTFTKVSSNVYVSYDDSHIIKAALILHLDEFISKSSVSDFDLVTYQIIKNHEDIDIMVFFHFGANKDKGYLAFMFSNIVKSGVDIFNMLDCVFQQPININKDAVYDSITLSALSTLTEISKSGYEPIITFNNGHKTFMFKKKSNQVVS